jgi:hypothetical protein
MKNRKFITITLEARNNKAEIRLPENYLGIFEKASASTEYHEKRLYNRFVEKFLGLQEFEREMFEDIASSGKYATETLGDLFGIFKAIPLYFIIQNAETYEQIGSIYASMNGLEYRGPKVSDMSVKYTELGIGVCDMYDGFFARGRFYGRMD